MNETLKTPVLIVGAGPVGLAMAVDLGWRGIECTLVERSDGEIEHPRTGLVAVRTMEAFRRWGFADRVRKCGFPEDYNLSMVFCTDLNGFLLDREDYPSMSEAPTPLQTPEKKQRCPQLWLQPILADVVLSNPLVSVRYEHQFESFTDTGDSVRSVVTDMRTGKQVTIESQYVVACDGATSAVRAALGIEMQGRLLSYSVNVLLRIPGFNDCHKMGEAERYLFVGPNGTWGNLTVVDGNEIWRLTVLGSEERMNLESFDAGSYVRAALGRDDVPFEVLSTIPWRRSEMLAERFAKGRVILAGDSLHTMSPTGGMGMNTGIQEVIDLGWKLQGLIEGWGGQALLDSYEIERRPVAQRNIAFSTQNFRAWQDAPDPTAVCDDTEEGARVRKLIGSRMRESTRVEWESLGLQIGYRYDDSPIVVPDDTPVPPGDYSIYVQTARPGARAPHAWLADGRSVIDLFGKEFVLLTFAGAQESEVNRLRDGLVQQGAPVMVYPIQDASIAELYGAPLVLVRPDGHVAWRGAVTSDASSIAEIVTGSKAVVSP
ncbi:FAD-dependent oxidoreductase [Paraburkholderia fungorum]|uniref:FAD-dependent oxidoreductase n=1 Tax=Paraburkholderia fungorum TaxID=134537 RepID=UPI002098336B|nr:FAD-dependent oxidoreductase [Paraburkholderia fungorum]USX06806.1 FAD-dependent oxidoreductase [Paraburkholderia fungorum]